jgi:heavy metal sensor kinase
VLFRTVRFRLTLWFALTLAVIMTASGLFWLSFLQRNLQAHLDERLLSIAGDIVTFHRLNSPPQPNTPACDNFHDFIDSHNWNVNIQILNAHGSIACTNTQNKSARLPLSKEALIHAARGKPHFTTIRADKNIPLRVLTYPILEDGRIYVLVQIGDSLKDAEESISHVRGVMWKFSPLLLLGLTICGWFLAGRTLAPVVRITRAIQRISLDNLNERLPVPKAGDEITQLAETFNTMLVRLADSVDRIRHFSADASHELRTPLAILKGETEVALRWAKDTDELRGTLASNLEEIDRMGRIIDDLLSLAKSASGELHLNLTDFSLSDMLQDIYLMGSSLAQAKGIEVTLDLQVEQEIIIHGDQLQLHRMFLNLMSNAVKYTPEGGSIALRLCVADGKAKIVFADSGIGIPAKHLPHIFERFYRVDESRNRSIGGTGLGLAIVKAIAESHGGRIEVASTPGVGSTFTVYLLLVGPPRNKKG